MGGLVSARSGELVVGVLCDGMPSGPTTGDGVTDDWLLCFVPLLRDLLSLAFPLLFLEAALLPLPFPLPLLLPLFLDSLDPPFPLALFLDPLFFEEPTLAFLLLLTVF